MGNRFEDCESVLTLWFREEPVWTSRLREIFDQPLKARQLILSEIYQINSRKELLIHPRDLTRSHSQCFIINLHATMVMCFYDDILRKLDTNKTIFTRYFI